MSKLVFCGDFYYDYSYITDDILKMSQMIQKYNWKLIVNLEAPLIKTGDKVEKRGPRLAQSEQAIEVLKLLNVVGVCLANNHIMDYGERALEETIRLLDENGIAHCGAGNNLDEARKPMKINLDGKDIICLNFGWEIEEVVPAKIDRPGAAPLKPQSVCNEIKKYSQEGERVITILHWGYEYNLLPQPYDIQLAHDIIDSGADFLVGHHAHVIQAKERYCGKNIYYSLGNFFFGSRRVNYKKTFCTDYKNECDYGLVVILDTKQWTVDEENIFYDRMRDYSSLKEKQYVTTDISGKDIGNNYIREVKRKKNHVNPILTDNEFLNWIKLWYLQVIVRKIFRRIWIIVKNEKMSICSMESKQSFDRDCEK